MIAEIYIILIILLAYSITIINNLINYHSFRAIIIVHINHTKQIIIIIMHKHIFITGSTDGIGKQTAIELAKANHYVYIHARDKQKADTTLGKIKT